MAASNKGRKKVTFTVTAPVGSQVSVAGDFNDWDASGKPLVDKKKTGVYSGVSMLPKGTYEYKFVVDNEWCVDPRNPNFVVTDLGTMNSVLEVG